MLCLTRFLEKWCNLVLLLRKPRRQRMSVPTTLSQELHVSGCLDGTVTLGPEQKWLMVRAENWSKHAFTLEGLQWRHLVSLRLYPNSRDVADERAPGHGDMAHTRPQN